MAATVAPYMHLNGREQRLRTAGSMTRARPPRVPQPWLEARWSGFPRPVFMHLAQLGGREICDSGFASGSREPRRGRVYDLKSNPRGTCSPERALRDAYRHHPQE